ncbi:MAG: glycosyl transferase [Phycisphaerae bacterium]|nr:MAG: glycosyl transferase [Phycisphaerae bacterium]
MDPSHGGPPAVALRLAAAQGRLGVTPSILAYDTVGNQSALRQLLDAIPGSASVAVQLLPSDGWSERVLATRAYRGVAGTNPRPGFIHLHGVWDPVLRAASRFAVRAGIPYAVTLHGMLDPWCLGATTLKRMKKQLALALVYRRVLNGAAFLHVLNRDERDLMAPLGLRPPTEVVPNGVFIEEFANLPPRDRFAATRPALAGKPYLLFLSRLHHKKGLDLLAQGFGQVAGEFPDLQLVVAGPDDGALGPLQAQVRTLGLERRVHVVGPLYGPDKLAALVGADVFCLTSRQEGFSMAVTEAMASRVPVLISDQCHFPEVEEAKAGRIVGLNPGAIAEGLRVMMANEKERRAMGEAGRVLVEARYTWPAIAAALVEAYRRHERLN